MKKTALPLLMLSALAVNLTVAANAADEVKKDQMSWDFSDLALQEKPLETLQAAGWTFNPAAESAGAITIPSKTLGILNGYLAIEDVEPKAAPLVTLPFGPRPNGEVRLKAAIFGTRSQFGTIFLMSGKTPLVQITIATPDGGTVKTGAGETVFTGTKWNLGGAIGLKWTDKGEATVTIDGLAAPVTGVKFLAEGVPDALQLGASFGSGVKKGLAVDDLQIGFPAIP